MTLRGPMDRGLAWDRVPCGLLTLAGDGTILDANQTLLDWVCLDREQVVGTRRLSELMSVGGRIYWETHLSPLLVVEGRVDEVAVELRAQDGRLPVLMTAVVDGPLDDPAGQVHVSLSSARERSRYERELLAARREAELAATHTRMLQVVTASLSRAAHLDAVVDALLSAATGPLGARAATYWASERPDGLVPRASRGEEPGASTRPSALAALRGRSALHDGGRVLVPLHGLSSLQGVLSLQPRDDAAIEDVPLEVLTAVGQHAGLALDRAHLYEQSTQVAHQLQQSLLTAETPEDERFVVTTAYRPGVVTLQVGGDWYDAFLVQDEVLAVVVGDVVGRGLPAASAMGQLRSAVRAIAGPETGPAGLVTRLDRFVQQVEAAATATLAYAEIDLGTGRVRFLCAGHMPPLLLPVDGPPRLLWEGRSTPLGIVIPHMARTHAELVLRPGDQLLFYTDGLIERRDRLLSAGFDVLTATATELRDTAPAALVDELTARLLKDEEIGDDVCVLLLTWQG
ncbi:MAG: hypothetical protein JWP95_484 [Actinotalea sp.]|nr:hypothetical protein [Actinotalea sp.]